MTQKNHTENVDWKQFLGILILEKLIVDINYEKMANISSAKPQIFSRRLRRREIPPYTYILAFYCISISQIFRKIKDFLSLSLFSQIFLEME